MNKNNHKKSATSVLKRKILASAITFVYLGLAMAPVYASDTEIYVQRDDSAPISPTLMMMFDTSGSMDWCVDNPASSSCSDTTKKRINVLKKAMKQILRGDNTVTPPVAAAPGYIKMGLSKYHTTTEQGGYVFYPARPLDAFVQLNPNGYINAVGATGDSDAVQGVSFVNYGTQLAIGATGSVNNAAGFQFANVVVPKGAVVQRAYIEVTASATQSGPALWRIQAQDTDSASEFTTGSNINSRTYRPAQGEDITPDAWVSGERQRIFVTEAVNDIVNRSGWCGSNNLAIKISNVSVSGVTPTQRTAYSYEGAPTEDDRPKLVVEYTMDTESTTSCALVPRTTVVSLSNNEDDVDWDSIPSSTTTTAIQNTGTGGLLFNKYSASRGAKNIGLRYRNVPLPLNATIDSAYLKAKAAVSANNVRTTSVTAFDSSNLPAFCSSTNASSCNTEAAMNLRTVLSLTSAEATWSPPSNSIVAEQLYAIPVTEAVREVTSTTGWTTGNSLGFRLKNSGTTTNDTAGFYSRDGSSSKAVQLEINWRERVTDLRNVLTVRDELDTAVNALTIPSGTPLGAAYAEASRYLYGMTPKNTGGAPLDYDARVVNSPIANATGLKYISPIPTEDECSANYIFLLTDGEPANDGSVKQNVEGITGEVCTTSGTTTTKNWECMKKLAEYNTRQNNRINKPIRTNTVILGPLDSARTNMQAVANAGQGTFYEATNTAALVNAISNTISDAANRSGTIAAPGVAVNQINRISHLDQLYYAVFKPDTKYRWDGNLKRYRINGTTNTILDALGAPAVDPDTGLFSDGTQSYWSTAPDGSQAVLGGAASRLLDPSTRSMFTYLGALSATNTPLTPIVLGEPFNTNAKTVMGFDTSTADDVKFKNLINWYKGYAISSLDTLVTVDATTPVRKTLGAALHSQPVLINYGYTGSRSNAANPIYQKNYIFYSTMGGTLHATDANTGNEVFSFIPGEKLNTLMPQYINDVQVPPEFGMDLTWTYYYKDTDLNGQIGTGDKVYLYGGMRMGGRNYYALNLTNLASPSLLFSIQAGSTGFLNMGQTWSQPVLTTIKMGGVGKDVMIFGGGYDPRHEVSGQIFTGNDLGNQVYIVDAFTGELIWSGGGNTGEVSTYVSDMKYSVPSSLKPVDMDGDGNTDNIYFGDLGGQVFRIDLKKTATNSTDLVKRVRLIAKLGQTGVATPVIDDQRRFYEPPEVALFKDATTQKLFTTVAIGSGYRSRPLNKLTEDNFFVLFDNDAPRTDLTALTAAEEVRTEALGGLQPVITKTNLSLLNLASTAAASTTNMKGWYIDFAASGEKVLAPASIYASRLSFTTYLPSLGTTNCSPVVGRSRLYGMCMPYGDVCDAGVTSRLINDNVMSGISGGSQMLVLPNSSGGGYSRRLVTGTDVTIPLGASGNIVPTMQPIQRWREKTRNQPAP